MAKPLVGPDHSALDFAGRVRWGDAVYRAHALAPRQGAARSSQAPHAVASIMAPQRRASDSKRAPLSGAVLNPGVASSDYDSAADRPAHSSAKRARTVTSIIMATRLVGSPPREAQPLQRWVSDHSFDHNANGWRWSEAAEGGRL